MNLYPPPNQQGNNYYAQPAASSYGFPSSVGSGGGNASSDAPVFKFQNVSPEMLNFGISAGQDIINKQTSKWMPGVSVFWLNLKFYFSVCILLATYRPFLILIFASQSRSL
jgi:hypothetical protein